MFVSKLSKILGYKYIKTNYERNQMLQRTVDSQWVLMQLLCKNLDPLKYLIITK